MSNDWWSRKLSNPQQTSSRPPTTPPGRVPYAPVQGETNVPVQYDPNTDQVTVTKAQHLKQQSGRCPDCNSGNYFAPQGTSRQRCYDCGYPLTQSGSGPAMPTSDSGPAVKSQ